MNNASGDVPEKTSGEKLVADDAAKEIKVDVGKTIAKKATGKIIGLVAAGVAVVVIVVVCLVMLGGGDKSGGNGNGDNTSNNGGNGGNDSNGNDERSERFEYGEEYISKHLKGDYWIIYKISTYDNGDADTKTVEIRKTDKGYYLASDGSEVMYIKNEDKFDTYYGSDGEFTNSGMQIEEEYVKAMISGISLYMTAYATYESDLVKSGSDTVAGRSCDKYVMEYSHPYANYKFKYTYCIDKATGVGLKHTMEASAGGEKAGQEFEATKFQTSGVSLPDYK